MNLTSQQLNRLAAELRIPPGFPGFAAAAAVLLDQDGNIAFDPSSPSTPITKHVRFATPQIVGLGAATSGDITAFLLPQRAVVLSSTVKALEAVAGGAGVGTLTSNNTNVTAGDTVLIGNKTYTFQASLTPLEGEVLRGGSADASLLNLIRAINHTGTPGTDYSCAAAHTQVSAAASVTAHAFAITALLNVPASLAIATTTPIGATLSWGAVTLATPLSASTARLISAQNNYGTAFDVKQAIGAEVFDFYGTAKSELMGGVSTLNMHMTSTGTTLDQIYAGIIDAWVTYFLRPL